jgi:hypothetical protein
VTRAILPTPVATRRLVYVAHPVNAPTRDGILANLARALVERCDAVWLVGGRVSSGMQIEADHAIGRGIDVIDLTHMGDEPPGGGP